MISVYKNFLTDSESHELITHYNSNLNNEMITKNKIYSFRGVDIPEKNYYNYKISKKLNLINPQILRIQLIDSSIQTNEYMHSHRMPWSYVIFLNDNFDGGNLIFENIEIKPEKNKLIVFSGNLKHRVDNVKNGNRYTFVSFTEDVAKLNLI